MKLTTFIELEEGESAASLARACRSNDEYKLPCNIIHACPFFILKEDECRKVTTEDWKNILREGFIRQVYFLE